MKRVVINTNVDVFANNEKFLNDINTYIPTGQESKLCLIVNILEIIDKYRYKELESFLEYTALYCKRHGLLCNDFELITNFSCKPFRDSYTVPDTCHHIWIDNFRLVAYLSQKFNLTSKHPPLTNINDNNKYLCKFGKLDKPHRYKLYCLMRDSNLFHDNIGMWSLVTDKSGEQLMEDMQNLFIHDYPSYSLNQMSEHHRLLPDLAQADAQFCENGTFHHTGYPFDIEPYLNTKFSLVSESQCVALQNLNDVMITEKTWIPMSLKHPMLLNASAAQAQILKDSGFESADNFEFCNDLNEISYQEAKDLFAKCYVKFLDTPSSTLFEIADHNYEIFKKLALDDYNKVADQDSCVHIKIRSNNRLPHIKTESNLLSCILKFQYANRSSANFDWDWNAINKFSDDK